MAKRNAAARHAAPKTPKNPLAASRPRRSVPPEKASRSRSAKRATPPAPADTSAPTTTTSPSTTSAAIATADRRPTPHDWRPALVEQLRGAAGDDIRSRIKAHALAPDRIKGLGPTAHQLARILESSETSRWQAAAEAVAEELAMEAAINTREADVIAESIASEPMQHFARCEACKAGVHFTPLASGYGFAIVTRNGYDFEQTFGIGPNNIPVCPVKGHGEMQLADDQLRPAHQAIAEVAAKTNGNGKAEQRQLFDVTKPFNFEGAWMDIEQQQATVDELVVEHEDDAARAKESKKKLDTAREVLGRLVNTYRERRLAKAKRLGEEAEKAARDAEEAAQREGEGDGDGELRGGPVPLAAEAQPEAAGAAL